MQLRTKVFTLGFIALSLLSAFPAFAQLGPNQQKIITIVNNIANFLGALFLIVATVMFLYTGYLYWAAQGKADAISKVHQSLLWAVIGTAVGLLAFVMPQIISTFLGSASQ